jgi:hypothetical protein
MITPVPPFSRPRLMFHSTDKRFAGHVTDTDKAVVEKVARVLLAKMDKP